MGTSVCKQIFKGVKGSLQKVNKVKVNKIKSVKSLKKKSFYQTL